MIDALVYKLQEKSWISSKPFQFLGLFFLSTIIWWIFEIINWALGNWRYVNMDVFSSQIEKLIFGTISFSTVLPAVFETFDLVKSIHLFDHAKLHKKHKLTKQFLFGMVAGGFLCLALPILFPKYFFYLIWLSFFLILDPINYIHHQPSIIGHLKDRKLLIPLSLALAGLVAGFFWEFWNYLAIPKWTYDIPYVGFFKIFEMPILGYLGYIPFAWELYAMYYFAKTLWSDIRHKLFK